RCQSDCEVTGVPAAPVLCKLAPETALFPLRRASRGVRLARARGTQEATPRTHRREGGPAGCPPPPRARRAGGGKAPRRPGRRRDPRSLRGGRGLLLLGRRARAGAAAPADLDFVRAEQRPRSPGGAGSSPARGTRQRRRKKRARQTHAVRGR
ncbi:unnamed protein product, partial [Prorocentrum cordatum]